jgi:predicted ATP-dependent endonuclease of OLD family
MKLKSIEIRNFKSISEIVIPFNSYGKPNNKSSTNILVGLNESGKTAILEAISFLSSGLDDVDYETHCALEAQEDDNYIDIFAYYEIIDQDSWRKLIPESLIPKSILNNIEIKNFIVNVYKNIESGAGEHISIEINDDFPFYKYIVVKKNTIVGAVMTVVEVISELKTNNNIRIDITPINAKSLLTTGQKLLDKQTLINIITSKIESSLTKKLPTVQIWKPSPDYLINEVIDLNAFKDNTSLSIPLRNIFHIYGKNSDEEIKLTIEKALNNQARCDELQERISDTITKYINKIWKEHKIKLRMSINSDKCQILIEDKDKKFAYYTMQQRSEGFKQFISLILSISAQNESQKLLNNIILIDEPEVHLHPSGIKYMRDEILKIGKNNNVVVSTHSQYMIDTETPERHFIITKNEAKTSINQLSDKTSFTEDNVLSNAFGLNLFKELLPQTIIVVEGNDDKNIFFHALKKFFENFFFSIKAAGGASKMPGFARLLNEEKISSFFLFDSDKEGRDNKNLILHNQKEKYSENNIFDLRAILNTLPADCTVEDLLPKEFVKIFFDNELQENFTLEDNIAFIAQLKSQSEKLKDKQKLDSLKYKLSIEFCEKYNDLKSLKKIEKINNFINSFKAKLDDYTVGK